MQVDPATEARVLGKLVLRGVLPKERVAEIFARRPESLSDLVISSGLLSEARLRHYLATEGEEAPELPGHEYLGLLGEGGTSVVFRVRAPAGEEIALKILRPELSGNEAEVKAFVAEGRLLQRLDHLGIVKGSKVGRHAGRWLSFMELAPGRTLQELIAEGGAFDEEGALAVILQVARTLEHLREQGVVHRDIKPGNIMVGPPDEDGVRAVKLIDLGFAARQSGAGATAGTAAYLSPEQARGQADLDVRSDIYSLGATLYQMVLGELPFTGDDQELVQKAVLEGLSAEATKGGRISQTLHYVIEKMMAKERDIRYQDPAEMIEDIEEQLAGKASLEYEAKDTSAEQRRIERLRRRRRKHR